MTEQHRSTLIPPPGTIRVELARKVREARRLRSLLRLSVQAEQDQQYVASLRHPPEARPEAAGREGCHAS